MKKRAVIALFVLMCVFFLRHARAEEKPVPQEPSLRPPVEYRAEGLPEPFQPEEEKLPAKAEEPEVKIQPPDLTIQGIVWGGAFPQAIINGKIVKIGDTLDGARIVDIAKTGLSLSFREKEFKLPSPAAGNVEGAQKPKGDKR